MTLGAPSKGDQTQNLVAQVAQFEGTVNPLFPSSRNIPKGAQLPLRGFQPPSARQRRNFRFQRKGRELPSITFYFQRTVRGAEYLTQGALAEREARACRIGPSTGGAPAPQAFVAMLHFKMAAAPVSDSGALSASFTANCRPESKVAERHCAQLLVVSPVSEYPSACALTGDSVEMGEFGGREALQKGGECDAESPLDTSSGRRFGTT